MVNDFRKDIYDILNEVNKHREKKKSKSSEVFEDIIS